MYASFHTSIGPPEAIGVTTKCRSTSSGHGHTSIVASFHYLVDHDPFFNLVFKSSTRHEYASFHTNIGPPEAFGVAAKHKSTRSAYRQTRTDASLHHLVDHDPFFVLVCKSSTWHVYALFHSSIGPPEALGAAAKRRSTTSGHGQKRILASFHYLVDHDPFFNLVLKSSTWHQYASFHMHIAPPEAFGAAAKHTSTRSECRQTRTDLPSQPCGSRSLFRSGV